MTMREAVRQFDAKSFVERHGGTKESRSSRSFEYLLPCPYLNCGSSRLRWNAAKDAWICWGCRRTGSTLLLIELFEQCASAEAIARVLEGYDGGNRPDKLEGIRIAPCKQRIERLPQIPWPTGVDVLAKHHSRAWQYLAYRGVTEAMLGGTRLGFGRSGWLENYILFPIYMDGGMVYWQGRATWERPGESRGSFKKTLNPFANETEGVATAQDVLFNYDRALNAPHVVICEGPFDAIKVGPHAVAMLGKSSSPQKVERLRRMKAMRYTVYLDRGEEERRCAERLASQLMGLAPTFVATPPEGHDPGSLTPEQNAMMIATATRFVASRL